VRGTHIPKTTEGAICQDMERSDSLYGNHRGGNFLGQKENDQVKGTHRVEIVEGGTCQDIAARRNLC
jgi:hypothetical protein